MTRRRPGDPEPGLPALYATTCARCGEKIAKGDRIAHLKGRYIHTRCASGGDDD